MSRRVTTLTPQRYIYVSPQPRLHRIGNLLFQQPGRIAPTIAQIDTKGDWADFVYHYQEVHLATVIEILQSIRQADMSPILSQIYSAPGGTEALDVLMKYMYAPPAMMLFRSRCRVLVTGLTPGP